MEIKKVGVIGAGMMGAEIALCFAKVGIETILGDISKEIADKGKEKQLMILEKSIKKGKLDPSKKEEILSKVQTTGNLNDMADCDFIVEAVLEVFEIKSKIYKQLNEICKPETIIASNTSSISITKLASGVSKERAKNFIGTHFNSPASVMKLVEVIPALLTSEECVENTMALLETIEKEAVKCKDVVGFGLNRLFHAFYLEGCRLVDEGVCSVEDVDKICLYGLGHPIGIFKLLDLMGHDLNMKVDEILFEAYGDRFRPSPVIQRLVDSEMLGRKSTIGFYDYNQEKPKPSF